MKHKLTVFVLIMLAYLVLVPVGIGFVDWLLYGVVEGTAASKALTLDKLAESISRAGGVFSVPLLFVGIYVARCAVYHRPFLRRNYYRKALISFLIVDVLFGIVVLVGMMAMQTMSSQLSHNWTFSDFIWPMVILLPMMAAGFLCLALMLKATRAALRTTTFALLDRNPIN